MKLVDIIHPELICTDLTSSGKTDVLSELGELFANKVQTVGANEITKILVERERLATTGIGEGVAIPHGKTDGIDALFAAVGISRTGVPFDSIDNAPVHIFIALLAPLSSSGDHLRALARISRLLKDPDIRGQLMGVREKEELFDILIREDGKN
jgi:PTS system nitrogen regulatory IIA component